jgi:hypothetical protein
MIEFRQRLRFKDGKSGANYVANPPCYMTELFDNEHSPFRTYLQTVEPDVDVLISVTLEVCQRADGD